MSPRLLIAFTLPLLVLPGCIAAAAVAAGATYGAISYHDNESQVDVPQDLRVVHTACLDALRELGFAPTSNSPPGPTEGTIEAGDAVVRIERWTGGNTRIRVRVGTFDTEDNERRAHLLLEAIQQRL